MTLVRGKRYKFTSQPEIIKFIGKERGWNQFELDGHQGVWCELLDEDLWMIEEVENGENDK